MTNCPNCGAVVNLESDKCENCGTPYEDVTTSEILYADNVPIVELYNSGVSQGVFTVNEARKALGLKPLRDQQVTEKLYSEAIKARRCYTGE